MAYTRKLKSKASRKSSRIGRNLLIILLLIVVAAVAFATIILFETEKPLVSIQNDISYLGSNTDILFSAVDGKSGLKSIVLTLEQNGKSKELYSKKNERLKWFYGAGPEKIEGTVTVNIKKAGLKNGDAELVITTTDFSLNNMLKGNETVTRYQVQIDTKAPRISLQHSQRYIRPGGAGLVVYDLSEPAEEHGAMVNGHFFKGFPLFGREDRYVAYIALEWNVETLKGSTVVATDKAGNEGKAIFSMVLKKVRKKTDRINVSDGFLNNKIPEFEEYYPEMSGSMLDKYLFANNEVRQRNARTIKEITGNPESDQIWQDRFLRMSGASKAGFGDHRTYYYQGKAIDKQVHLGMDIASTANVAIKAANRGKVVFADYLGIYGYTVILDHAQGISSLYSHLSRIDTAPGDMVDQGTVIAYSGATGMAGGDHLHFSMLINGIFVSPVEWWDQHWIDVNINDVLSQL